jgi:hypothetical protein
VIGWVDAAAWLVSNASAWLPSSLHDLLRLGIQGTVDSEASRRPLWLRMLDSPSAWEPDETSPWTVFLRQIDPDTQTRHEFLQGGRAALNNRVRHAAELLGLPEEPDRICEEIASWQVIERYWDDVASR